VEPHSGLVRWFWEVMEEFSHVERSLFLRFVWGRTRLPRTLGIFLCIFFNIFYLHIYIFPTTPPADFRGRDFVFQVSVVYLKIYKPNLL